MVESQAYAELNKAWKSTCRVLLGGEIGDLKDYAEWLREDIYRLARRKSSISGKDVFYGTVDYCENAKWAGLSEIDMDKKCGPLEIDEIKDIDSITEALRERFYYTGNIIMGNSRFIENCSNVLDSFYALEVWRASDCKRVAFSDTLRVSENIFGVSGAAYSGYQIKGTMSTKCKRCFETHFCMSATDCYYSTKLLNCRDCLFSFGADSKSHLIGNLALPKDKYARIKEKLLSEIREKLAKDKRVFSLLDVIEASEKYGHAPRMDVEEPEGPFDRSVIEQAFSSTTGVVLKKELTGIDQYSKFLNRHVPQSIFLKSPLSGHTVGVLSFAIPWYGKFELKNRILTENEIREIGKAGVSEKSLGGLSADVDVLAKAFCPVSYTTYDIKEGQNVNNAKCVELINAENCYAGSGFAQSKRCAFCFWPRESEFIFGSDTVWESGFCINSYFSKKLTRTFEVDSCESCSDLYYSHNCENIVDGMFCFNAKSLRHAIGNAVLPLEKYKAVKDSLLGQVTGELERKKDLKWDIYNLGCGGN